MHDEDEEAGPLEYSPHPTVSLAFGAPLQLRPCRLLLVALYGPASLFARSLIGNAAASNKLNFSRARQQSLADLYEVGSDLYLIFNQTEQPMKETHLSNFLQNHIAFQRAILLTALSRTTAKKPIYAPLAYVATSHAEPVQLPRFLEGIVGFAGDILQWGELNGKAVVCYVGIWEEYELSSGIIEGIFGGLRGKQGLQGVWDISQEVRRYNMRKYSNQLYL